MSGAGVRGEMKSYCLMGIKFLSEMMKKFRKQILMMTAQHCKCSHCPLDCPFLKGHSGIFMLYIYIYISQLKKIKSPFKKKKREREIKRFTGRQMMREFVTRRPDLQEMLMAVLWAKMNRC